MALHVSRSGGEYEFIKGVEPPIRQPFGDKLQAGRQVNHTASLKLRIMFYLLIEGKLRIDGTNIPVKNCSAFSEGDEISGCAKSDKQYHVL